MNYYRQIIRLGLPILVGQAGLVVLGFADTSMVGHYDTQALAAASFVNNLFNVALFAIIGFCMGLTPLIGALYAQNDSRGIGRVLKAGVRVNLVFSLLVTAVMVVLYFNVDRMGQPEQLLPLIRPYYRLYLYGLVPLALFNALAQWSYGIGNSALPMWIMLGANALNILGNYMLIYGNWGAPELGLYGAGLSTLAARVTGPIVMAAVFMLRPAYRAYSDAYRHARGWTRSVGKVIRTSLPVSAQMTCEAASFTFAAVVAGWLANGDIALAAFQVVAITGTLGFTLYYSLGTAISVVVAQEAGTANRRGMRRAAGNGYVCMLVLMSLSTAVFVGFGKQVMGVFTEDPRVLALAMSVLLPLVLYQIFDATQVCFANALRGTSHVMPMLWTAFVSYVLIGAPATWLVAIPLGMGLYGIVLSFSLSLGLAGLLFMFFFLRATRPKRDGEGALQKNFLNSANIV